jgi:hypothetical protein
MQQLSKWFNNGSFYIRGDMVDFLQEYTNYKLSKEKLGADLLDSIEIAVRESVPNYRENPFDVSQIKVGYSGESTPTKYRIIRPSSMDNIRKPFTRFTRR